jgi:type VI protein secretion system component VasK
VGGILWLEITGVFFLLPVVAFAPRLWDVRANWALGPDHRRFLVTAAVITVFLYLSVTSFWRARKR